MKTLFRRGLTITLQSEQAFRDEGRNLNELIELTIHLNHLIRRRINPRTMSQAFPEHSYYEPMQLGFTCLTQEERKHRLQNQLPVLWPSRAHEVHMPCTTPHILSVGEFL